MPELLSTLPGDIPGLILRGSPVVDDNGELGGGIVRGELAQSRSLSGFDVVWDCGFIEPMAASRLSLDLSDRTGRVHAAWWAMDHDTWNNDCDDEDAVLAATVGDCDEKKTDRLCRLVLRLAGRST